MLCPKLKSKWVRKDAVLNGSCLVVYKVLCITNLAHVVKNHPPQVVYRGSNEHVWSIPLNQWPNKLKPFKPNSLKHEQVDKDFNIWSEGLACTGQSGKAQFHGSYKGITFAEACEAWAKSTDDPNYFDRKHLTYWGCKLFNNESDARKSFG